MPCQCQREVTCLQQYCSLLKNPDQPLCGAVTSLEVRLKTGFAVPFQASDISKNYAREARNKSRCFKGQKSKISLKTLHSQGMEIFKNTLQNEAIKN